ncbi:MAG TPA: terpene synthase family protein [Amycolatopsis sp.]|uniref:terpene synthase family protein n=1 Tax=Amycolatopsis sp. TaxID=37632 RepID=UPI002B46A116|nr:terpene synthase family protein [Amycolatopsis sp.]HKS48359.1 terpene synthase family protein [Amycolatopsis sp.]
MPIEVDFHLPFPAPRPERAEVERAGQRAVRWAHDHGLLQPTDSALGYYVGMMLADVAAGFCPDASGADLELMTDVIVWTAVCDDFFDGPAGDDLEQATSIVDELIAVTEHPPITPTDGGVLVNATADLWTRLIEPMSDRWRERARQSWQRFLRSFLAEVIARRSRVVPTLDDYLALRRESMAMYLYLDATERVNRYEVPSSILASEEIRRLGLLEIDIIAFCNDVHSVEHEEARGDTHNLVLVLEHEGRGTREAVIEEICRLVHDKSEQFLSIAAEIPALCRRVGATANEQAITQRYVTAMTHQIRVTHDWSMATRRYSSHASDTANSADPAGRRQYLAFS